MYLRRLRTLVDQLLASGKVAQVCGWCATGMGKPQCTLWASLIHPATDALLAESDVPVLKQIREGEGLANVSTEITGHLTSLVPGSSQTIPIPAYICSPRETPGFGTQGLILAVVFFKSLRSSYPPG